MSFLRNDSKSKIKLLLAAFLGSPIIKYNLCDISYSRSIPPDFDDEKLHVHPSRRVKFPVVLYIKCKRIL